MQLKVKKINKRDSDRAKAVVKQYCEQTGLLSLEGKAAEALEKLIVATLNEQRTDIESNGVGKVGEFEGEARVIQLDGHHVTALWTDGVMLSADNGNSKMMPGVAPFAFALTKGTQYRVSVSKIENER